MYLSLKAIEDIDSQVPSNWVIWTGLLFRKYVCKFMEAHQQRQRQQRRPSNLAILNHKGHISEKKL